MGIFLTEHILARMNERGITRNALDHILQNITPYPVGNVWYYDGVWEEKKLRIIVTKKRNHTILITSYFYE